MAITAEGAVKQIRKWAGVDAVESGYEFANLPKDEKRLWERIQTDYRESFENLQPYCEEIEINKKAYFGAVIDFFKTALKQEQNGGLKWVYTSDLTSSFVESIMSILLEGKPVVYPMTMHNPDFDYTTLVDSKGEPLVEEGKEATFVNAMWRNIFRDVQERLGIHAFNEKGMVESLLTSTEVCFIGKRYDYETHDEREFIHIHPTEDVGRDWESEGIKDCRFIFPRFWETEYDVIAKHPDKWKEIHNAGRNNTDKRSFYGITPSKLDSKRGKLCYIEGYIRDNTQEQVFFNLESGDRISSEQAIELEQLEDELSVSENREPNAVVEEKTLHKYPAGRRVRFLDTGTHTILPLSIDTNPYDRIPYVIHKQHPVAGHPMGRNVATSIVPSHYSVDFFIQKGAQNIQDAGTTKVIVQTGTVRDPDQDDNRFQFIESDNPGGSRVIQARGVAADSLGMANAINDSTRQKTGIEATSQGKNPGSIQSGTGLLTLIGQSNRKLAPSLNTYKEFLVDVFKHVADVLMDVLEAGTIMRVTDEDDTPYVLPVAPRDVTLSVFVKSDADSALPSSPVALANFILGLANIVDENGIPAADFELILQALPIPGMKERIERYSAQLQQMIETQAAVGAQGAEGGPKKIDLNDANNPGLKNAQSPGGQPANL